MVIIDESACMTEEEQESLLEDDNPPDGIEDAVGDGIDPVSEKCDHGVYIARGDTTARYCTGCNPCGYGISGVRRDVVLDCARPEPEIDAADYMSMPIWARLDDANRMEAQ